MGLYMISMASESMGTGLPGPFGMGGADDVVGIPPRHKARVPWHCGARGGTVVAAAGVVHGHLPRAPQLALASITAVQVAAPLR